MAASRRPYQGGTIELSLLIGLRLLQRTFSVVYARIVLQLWLSLEPIPSSADRIQTEVIWRRLCIGREGPRGLGAGEV